MRARSRPQAPIHQPLPESHPPVMEGVPTLLPAVARKKICELRLRFWLGVGGVVMMVYWGVMGRAKRAAEGCYFVAAAQNFE